MCAFGSSPRRCRTLASLSFSFSFLKTFTVLF
uniref:Uncharacterized protein n=1 Tax=Anguilla anguilla TaxID=7936 RepID=A0A0E9VMK3_ANGAN